jgi:hypothetical protein
VSFACFPSERDDLTTSSLHSNTPENKPVTSSRDTQEVPYDAGLEVLRILSSYQSRTSLLQDLPWYEAKLSQGGADKEDDEETVSL